ncbi:hypothetical protein HNR60_003288 [Rhodopseudomonas rhenobacensis]|uniref:Uncharacterized protein n=1 Tax=Rhodopseudomonas rhenobacensis TaxID=87461 RepID=A0A7W7Z5Q9_9BRAD|nr:hypothetical protein [Rhodopseudomonas rhenobacensis]MBB5048521.1 hypothetical protein [Rhodopseudomonas rhenobacensis]
MAPEFSRRALIQSTVAVAATAALPGSTSATPPPALDLEAFFGPEAMALIRARYRDGHYCQGVGDPRHVPGFITADGRFGMSTPARYALAKFLTDGQDVIFSCPKEAINRDQLALHLFRKHVCQLPYPLYSLYGPLRAPPHDDAIMLTKEEHLYWARVNPEGVPQFLHCKPV